MQRLFWENKVGAQQLDHRYDKQSFITRRVVLIFKMCLNVNHYMGKLISNIRWVKDSEIL